MIRFRPSLIFMLNVFFSMAEILAKNFLLSIRIPSFNFLMSSFVNVGSVRTW